MTDLKISQFTDGGLIQDTDSIAAVRAGVNTKVTVGTMAAEDAVDYVTLTGIQTLEDKTVNLTDNTLSGTKAQFDTACSDDNFAYVGTANNFTQLQTMSVGANVGNSAQASATTLDWYEEGTFTPTVTGQTSAGTATYTVQTGFYTRIGRTIHIYGTLTYSGHTGTGNMRISSLPFTIQNISNGNVPLTLIPSALTVGAGLATHLLGLVGSTNAGLYTFNPTTGVFDFLAMDAAATLYFSGTYQI